MGALDPFWRPHGLRGKWEIVSRATCWAVALAKLGLKVRSHLRTTTCPSLATAVVRGECNC